MTALRIVPKPTFTPRELGALLTPSRSGQYVRQRIKRGEIAAERLPSGDYAVPWQEVRRLTGQDLTAPGHEGVSSPRDEAVRALRRCISQMGVALAEAQRVLSEIDAP